MKQKSILLFTFALCGLFIRVNSSFAQGTAFTYQGRLNDGASPANGSYDMTFALFNIASGAGQVGSTVSNSAVAVSNGLFTVAIDFGTNFSGDARWLEIGVRTIGNGVFATLNPRQKITPTPYAITAANVIPGTGLSGTYGGAVTMNNAANQFTGAFAGNGTDVTNVNAATLNGLSSAGFWKTNGNAGANPATGAFIGTSDNFPIEFKANGARVLRLEPRASGSPNVVAGASANSVAATAEGATIAGGGLVPYPNSITESYATIGGGTFNRASGAWSTLAGGRDNNAEAPYAIISGGNLNWIRTNSDGAIIAGGWQNLIESNATWAVISAGVGNVISNGANFATIGGGKFNRSTVNEATVSGGAFNNALAFSAAIGGGGGNTASGEWSTIPGGRNNVVTNSYATIGGGLQNTNNSFGATIGGGNHNFIASDAQGSSIGGGQINLISQFSENATIAGGTNNTVTQYGSFATIGGGWGNTACFWSTIGGGIFNTTSNSFATVSGGYLNVAAGDSGTVPGGLGNHADGAVSFAAGFGAQAVHDYTFVWADHSDINAFSSTGTNQFLIRAAGGVGIGVNAPQQQLSVATGMNIDQNNVNVGTVANSLRFGSASGEAIGSNRSPGANQYGLDFYTGGINRMVILNSGNIGMGMNNPGATLDVNGTARIEGANNWDVNNNEGDFRVGNGSFRFKIGVANGGGGSGDVWMRAHGGTARLFLKTPGGTTIYSNEGQTAGVSLAAGGTSWAVISDRNAKKDFAPVDSGEILEKLAAMPITQWHYKWEEESLTPHIGPMAQDFKAAFYPGTDDKSITTQEADGVALAAIQGLNQKLENELKQRSAENTELKQRLSQLEQLVAKLAVEKN
jgi:hypothetical protein